MSEPPPRLVLSCLRNIYKFCIHFSYFDSRSCIVWNVELKSEWTELFELKFIYHNILVIWEDHFQGTVLSSFKVLNIPDDFSFLKIAVSITIFSILYLIWNRRLTAYPLLCHFIKRFHIMYVLEAECFILLCQICEVDLVDFHGELKRYLYPLCS